MFSNDHRVLSQCNTRLRLREYFDFVCLHFWVFVLCLATFSNNLVSLILDNSKKRSFRQQQKNPPGIDKRMLLAERISSYGCTWEVWGALKKLELLSAALRATLMYRWIPKPPMPPPPRGQNPGHLTFLKNFGQIPRYVASLDGQMPHPFELQRGSNPAPSRHVKANCGNKFCKIFSHYEFLVQLVFAPHFKQRHISR